MPSITGNITANGQSVTAVVGKRDLAAKIAITGTYAGVVVSFEVSPDGGTTWLAVVATRTDSVTAPAATFTASTNGLHQLVVPCRGMTHVRVRATGYTSGTAVIRIIPDDGPMMGLSSTTVVDTELPTASALADASGNPTVPLVGADLALFNGTNWDRQRNNISPQTVDSSSARTASGNGATYTNYNGAGVIFFVNVTAVSGTTPTMTVRLQESWDGTNWRDIDTTNLQTASITAAVLAKLELGRGLANVANASRNGNAPRLLRAAWTIGGTTPSFTFSTTFQSVA